MIEVWRLAMVQDGVIAYDPIEYETEDEVREKVSEEAGHHRYLGWDVVVDRIGDLVVGMRAAHPSGTRRSYYPFPTLAG